MKYWNLPHEDSLFKVAYEQYRQFFSIGEIKPKFVPYGSIRENVVTPLELVVYYSLLAEHSQGVANEINNLYYRIAQLSAWEKVLRKYDGEEKLFLLFEFIDPIVKLAIGLPYVIKCRFIYTLSHLSHQANLILDSNWDESRLPVDRRIELETMKRTTANWEGYDDFLKFFNQLNDKSFVSQTRNFRNSYQHCYPFRVEMGHTEFVSRIPQGTNCEYTITSKIPLKIIDIQPYLVAQFDIAMECYKLYDKIVCNQLVKLHSK